MLWHAMFLVFLYSLCFGLSHVLNVTTKSLAEFGSNLRRSISIEADRAWAIRETLPTYLIVCQ